MTGNPPTPVEDAEIRHHESKKNRLLAAVLGSVSIDILGLLLTPEENPTPHDLIQKIIAHINRSTKEDHQLLKIEAESITLDNKNVDKFITDHLQVRQKMVAARYPSITEEATTIDFLLTGLKKHPTLTPIVAHLLSNPPKTIREFTRMFKSLSSLYQPANTPAPHTAVNQRFTGDYGTQPRYNQHRQNYNRSQFPTRRIPYNQLCNYHKSIGVRCNHTDSECRNPNHPKYRNYKPEANYVQAMPPQPMQQPNLFPPPLPIQANHPPLHANLPDLHPDPQAYDIMQNEEPDPNSKYILDSGAHPTHVNTAHPNMAKLRKPLLTQTATTHQTRCTHSGTLHLTTTKNKTLSTHALVNPDMQHNLLSVQDMARRYGLVAFTPQCGYILDTRTSPPTIIGTAPWSDTHYELAVKVNHASARAARAFPITRTSKTTNEHKQPHSSATSDNPITTALPNLAPPPTTAPTPQVTTKNLGKLPNPPLHHRHTQSELTAHNWHTRLNHAHPNKLALIAQQRLIPIMPKQISDKLRITCTACDAAKLHPAPHKIKTHDYPVGAYVSSDTCGPIKPTSRHGNNHMLLVICAVSKFVLAQFVKDRKDLPRHIQAILDHITARMQHPLRDFRTDNAKEYTSNTMKALYQQYGLTLHLRTPHQPQENGIAERMNRTIMQSVRALLHTAGLDDSYWEDAARDTIFKYNILHHASIKTSPYHLWYNTKPNLTRIYTFGQLGTIPIYEPKKKLEPRADPARYMYATSLTHIVACNLRTGNYQHIRAEDFHPYQKSKDPTITTSAAFKTRTNYTKSVPTEISVHTPAPATLAQARKYPDAQQWGVSHNEELQNLDTHKCIKWMPADFEPPAQTIIPLMMIYRYKRSAEGHIVQRKARCNLRGDLMRPGLHYNPQHTTT